MTKEEQKELIKEMKSWQKDFKKGYPKNLCIEMEDDTFEGSAYNIMSKAISIMEDDKEYFPITSLSREDITGAGYPDAKKLSDDDMERFADKMANAFLDGDYWPALRCIAEDTFNLKKHEE